MNTPIKNIAKGLSILVLFFFALSYYSHLVYNAALDKKDSFITHHLTNFANYPNLIKEVLFSNELAGIPSTFLKNDTSFQEKNELSYDLFALNSFWNIDKQGWDIKLYNLKNDSVLFKWTLPEKGLDFKTTDWAFPNSVPRNCIIMPDKSIILSADESANLFRLDASSKPMWEDHSLIYHHSLNLDADSNIWACTADLKSGNVIHTKGILKYNGDVYKFKENYITKIDSKTGKRLFHKGLTEIFEDNNYENFAFGFSEPDVSPHDPMHLNDIQPIYSDSEYWKKGDLLISVRNRSLIVLYRPSTNKILRIIYGNFMNQHDVDVFSDNEISVFNNNFIQVEQDELNNTCDMVDTLKSSEVVVYNFKDSTCRPVLNKYFIQEKIFTKTQGMHTKLANGDLFVESQNQAKLFIINESGFVLKKTMPSTIEGFNFHTNWIRVYEKLPY